MKINAFNLGVPRLWLPSKLQMIIKSTRRAIQEVDRRKLLMRVNLIIAIMITCFIQVSATSFAQLVTINQKNASIEQVFKLVRQQSGYNILYDVDLLKNTKLVSINIKEASVSEAMKEILHDQQISFTIKDNTIILNAKVISEAKAPSFLEKVINFFAVIDVGGKVVSEKDEPIKGATVRLKGTRRAVITGEGGSFLFRNIEEGSILVISCVGFNDREVKVKESLGNIKLQPSNLDLEVADVFIKKQTGTKVDLKNRTHQNLGQILEGGVPGLTLKPNITTQEGELYLGSLWWGGEKTKRELYDSYMNDVALARTIIYGSYEDYERNTSRGANDVKEASTTTNNGLVPQLRGASNFANGNTAMLIVIDGFPQDDFPSDYPMNNVESIEVVSDPEECIKWGPKAAGGIIFITTKQGQPGQVNINYSSNFYFSAKPNNSASKLQLPSSADLLDYYKETYDRGLAKYSLLGKDVEPKGISPAEWFLYELGKGNLSQGDFKNKWDSLGSISNRGQMRMLQQNIFNQNHSLQVSGGSQAFSFSVNGLYKKNLAREVGSQIGDLGLDIKNSLSLNGGKFKARWMLSVMNTKNSKGVYGADDLEPYQLLFDKDGNYIYNYRLISPSKNSSMLNAGYFESGKNLYEDAISSENRSNTTRVNTALDFDYELLKVLKWVTSLKLSKSKTLEEKIIGANSSEARNLFNDFGVPQYNNLEDLKTATGVDFYIPIGDLYTKTKPQQLDYKIGSGLSFNRALTVDHTVAASINFGMGGVDSKRNPYRRLYAYNSNLESGLPLLGTQSSGLINFLGASLNFGKLLSPGLSTFKYDRNINLNGDFRYSFKNRYDLSMQYLTTYSPDYGNIKSYSATTSKTVAASWFLSKESFMAERFAFISNMKLTVSAGEISIPRLLASQITGRRFEQSLWDNAGITITGFNFSEQSGQKNQTLSGEVDAGLFKDQLMVKLKYSNNSLGDNNWDARITHDIASASYFHFPLINMLRIDLAMQSLNPYQGMRAMMGSNSVTSGGGFGMPVTGPQGSMPPSTLNKEANLQIGLHENDYSLAVRYYNKTTKGISQGSLPADPSTGLQSKTNYSEIANEGVDIGLSLMLVRKQDFEWRMTINGAYNVNKAINVPETRFSMSPGYMTASRSGYSVDNLWSFNWAGLDNLGNPQIYNGEMEKVLKPDASSLVYSGNTRAPYSGGLFNNWNYKSVFVGASLVYNFGHVVRRFIPTMTPDVTKDIQIGDRWRKPGDENITDIASIGKFDAARSLVIQNSSNSILPADNIRLTEVQLGYEFPSHLLQSMFFKNLRISAQVENLGLWTRNKLHLDPEAMSSNGPIGLSRPTNYVLSINLGL